MPATDRPEVPGRGKRAFTEHESFMPKCTKCSKAAQDAEDDEDAQASSSGTLA
jgi:hypothetical protein